MNLVPESVRLWFKKKILNTVYEEYRKKNRSIFKDSNLVYLPYNSGIDSYIIRKTVPAYEKCELGLPVPPTELWLGYGKTKKEYLKGKIQIEKMSEIMKSKGYSIDNCKRILDFGCGAGRMIRWLKPYSHKSEIWGTDISSSHIYWANQYLNPPFNFATTTTIPHLPFEDRYFDLIYAGSVFTHIDDLAESWFLELRRISSENSLLYITIHDYHTVSLLDTVYKDQWLSLSMNNYPLYRKNKGDFEMLVAGRGPDSQVFYNIDYLKKSLNKIFDILFIEEEGYGYQTAILLKKK